MANKTTPSLSIVILSYNVAELLRNCLKSVLDSQRLTDRWQVIVVDNASTDNSVEVVNNQYPQVKLIQNRANLGFSAGNNVALRQIKSKFTLLLNPDTIVYPGTIRTVLNYMVKHPEVGAATCRVELPDGSLDYSCHRRFPNPWNTFVFFFTGLAKSSSYSFSRVPAGIHEIDALSGAFAMIRTSAGKKLAWLDQDYYWNGEDLDFCYRLKLAGWKVVYVPDVKITHFKGSSSGIWKTGKYNLPTSSKLTAVNSGVNAMRTFYDKHYSSNYPLAFNWFVYLGMFTLRIFRIVKLYLTGSK